LAAAHRIAHDSEHDLIHAPPKMTTAGSTLIPPTRASALG
jgi:hypothetical protein